MPITLCNTNDIGESNSKGFEIQGLQLFAVKKNGQIYLYQNRCPHLGIELHWQDDVFLDTSGTLIQCATHGAMFLIEDGLCVAGPCQGQALQAYPFEIVDHKIVIEVVND